MDGCAATAGMGCIGRLPIRVQKLLGVGQKGLGWMGPLPICPLQASSNFFSREDASKLVCCILLKLFGVFIFTKQCWIRLAFNAQKRSFTWLKLSQDYAHGVSEDCLFGGGVSWLALLNQVKSVKQTKVGLDVQMFKSTFKSNFGSSGALRRSRLHFLCLGHPHPREVRASIGCMHQCLRREKLSRQALESGSTAVT